jgi:WD40 repeat protein
MSNSVISNDLSDEEYKTLYHTEFGTFLSDGEVNVNWTWKELYDKIVDLKKGFISGITPTIIETTIGALQWEKEETALFEDNPQIAPVDREISKGYTGLQTLNSLPKPPQVKHWDPPLLLYGDFDGIKIYDSAADFFCEKRREYISIGEKHGQVTALAVCKFLEVGESTTNAPCCFIGYDSGSVASLTAALSDDGRSYNFSVEHHRHVHNSKVSAMTIMDCKSLSDGSHPNVVLLSAGYDGQVFYYPNALNPESSFDMTHTPAFSNSHPDLCPILTMTSTTFVEDDKQFCLVCTGDREGSVKLWLASDDILKGDPPNEATFHHIKWYKSKNKHCVTMAKFVNSHMLVSGNNQGDIRIWNLITMDETDEDYHGIVPGLTLCYSFKHAHNGPVKTAMSLGDVIITSGGNDGNLFGWDATSGKQLGVISCHYGQETVDETTGEKGVVKSCVVGAQVMNNRLISLCRDGVLSEWRFSML